MALSKIISIKKIKTPAVLFLVFFWLFFVSKTAFAFLGIGDIGLLDLAKMQLDALDFVESTILKYFYILFIMLIGSEVFVLTSASLLQWAVNLPINLGNDLVRAGWDFASGLANLFFILIFLGIALAYIFKAETWNMKKALPALIIVALLTNFSFLFVQIFVDIAQITWNALLAPLDVNFVKMAVEPLASNVHIFVIMISATLGTYLIAALVPYGNVISSFGTASWFILDITGITPGNIFLKSVFLIFMNFIMGSIFFAYFLLFLARIIIIWFLAIFAPLAFFAYILPSTRKYFNQWFRTLLDWSFLGIIAFFLMGLGMNLFSLTGNGSLLIWGDELNTGRGTLPGFIYNYVFLSVYLLVVLWVSKKLAPKGTEMAWQAGKLALTQGGSLAAGKTRQLALKGEIWKGESELKRASARMRPLQAKEAAGGILTPKEKAQMGKWTGRREMAESRVQMLKAVRIQGERRKLLQKTKDVDDETAKAVLSAELTKHGRVPAHLRNKDKTQALVELLAERDAPKEEHKYLYEEAWKNAGPDDMTKNRVKKLVLPRMLHWGKPEEIEAYINKMNSADIEKLNIAAKTNDGIVKQVVGTMRSDLISRLGSQSEIVFKKVQNQIETTLGQKWKTSPDNLSQKELGVLRSLHLSSATTNLNWKTYGSLQEIEDKIKNLGQPPQPAKKEPSKIVTPGSEEFKEEQEKIRKKIG